MPPYFVDTWFFIALFDRFDSHHRIARRLESTLALGSSVTHDAVFGEFLAFVAASDENNRAAAARLVREWMRRNFVVTADRALFLRALDLYERRLDKAYSLVDCMSMIVMRDRGITHVLTNDHHFAQEGFTLVNE
jgi:predicted nucleic acid-binding protein